MAARGFSQRYGIDFFDVFASVTRLTTLRLMCSMVAAKDLEWTHVDVKQAFINGTLKEKIYIGQPVEEKGSLRF